MNIKLKDLKNKNVVITGGSGFLGNQICNAFLNQGSRVFILDVKKPKLKSKVTFLKTDITKEIDLKKILIFFKKKKIKIDVLINGAARDHIPSKKNKNKEKLNLENFSEKVWAKDLNVGLTGSLLTTKIFGSYMASKKGGVILNISSDLGIIAPNQSIYKKSNFIKPVSYSVIKHGIIGLTKYTASYWAKKNIRCNAIAPGGIFNNQDRSFVKEINQLIPLGRMAKKNEYDGIVLFLCSDHSSYMTGSIIVADGGRTII
ncbi:SDR family oxidoreductase [Candidatus Pelagibacter sp.]|nr:SDR family oxidoreductase [Candidatus Pelagibacter sp.]